MADETTQGRISSGAPLPARLRLAVGAGTAAPDRPSSKVMRPMAGGREPVAAVPANQAAFARRSRSRTG